MLCKQNFPHVMKLKKLKIVTCNVVQAKFPPREFQFKVSLKIMYQKGVGWLVTYRKDKFFEKLIPCFQHIGIKKKIPMHPTTCKKLKSIVMSLTTDYIWFTVFWMPSAQSRSRNLLWLCLSSRFRIAFNRSISFWGYSMRETRWIPWFDQQDLVESYSIFWFFFFYKIYTRR